MSGDTEIFQQEGNQPFGNQDLSLKALLIKNYLYDCHRDSIRVQFKFAVFQKKTTVDIAAFIPLLYLNSRYILTAAFRGQFRAGGSV